MTAPSFENDVDIIDITVPGPTEVITIAVPGIQGPTGAVTVGNVTTSAPGGNAVVAARTLGDGSQVVDFTIPRGATGPSNAITIGTVTSGVTPSASLTGTSPSQTLNLVLPKGDTGNTGPTGNTGATGPANTLTIGTVSTGSAAASITGTAPNQTLNLTVPQGIQGPQGTQGTQGIQGPTGNTGATGPANTLTIGAVTTGTAGSSAAATVTGTAPNQVLNLTIPTGAQGPAGAGAPDATTTVKGSVRLAGDLAGTADSPTVASTFIPTSNAIVRRDLTGNAQFNTVYGRDYNGFKTHASLANTYYLPDPTNALQSPFDGIFHDMLAFNRHWGTPTIMESTDGTTAFAAVATPANYYALFNQKQNQSNVVISAATKKGIRFTWNSPNVSWSIGTWLVIGYSFESDFQFKTVVVETSADGTAWTTRHTSTYNAVGAPVWHYINDWQGDGYFRLTIRYTTPGTAIGSIPLSSIRVLTPRWGDQGGGSELSLPFDWDANRNLTFVQASSSTAPTAAAHLTRKDYVDALGTPNNQADTILRRNSNGDVAVRQVFVAESSGPTSAASVSYVNAIGTDQPTVNTVMRRNSTSETSAAAVFVTKATPTLAAELTRKDYVDGKTWPVTAITATGTASSTTYLRGDGTWATPAVGAGSVTAANITDATTIGRTVLTSADAAAVRTAIGAGTSNLVIGTTNVTAKAGDYTPPSDGAAGVATMRTLGTGATQAAAGNDARLSDARTPLAHTQAASTISDSTTVGRSVLTAVDAAAARTAIGAGTSSLAIGTTNVTAKAGDYQPTSANITDATSAATANVVVKRDASGRAQVADPSAATDIANRRFVENNVPSLFNIKNYGAVGDNVADDTTAIQNAVNAAQAVGGQVIIPIGTFLISAPITLYGGMSVVGSSMRGSKIRLKNASNSAMLITPNDSIQRYGLMLSNFSLDGNAVNQTGTSPIVNIFAMNEAVLDRLYITNPRGSAIKVGQATANMTSTVSNISDCVIRGDVSNTQGSGIELISGSSDALIRNNDIGFFSVGAGVLLSGHNGATIESTNVWQCKYGYQLYQANRARFSNSLSDYAKLHGFIAQESSDLQLSNCQARESSQTAANVSDGFRFEGPATGQATNILLVNCRAMGAQQRVGVGLINNLGYVRIIGGSMVGNAVAAHVVGTAIVDYRFENVAGIGVVTDFASTAVSNIITTGTPSATTYLRGDGAWSTTLTAPVTLTDATTIATDASTGTQFRVTMGADRTLGAPTNPTDGQKAMWEITASAANRTLTLATGTAGSFKYGTDITSIPAIVSGTTTFIGAIYRTSSARWHVLAVSSGH